VFEKKYLTFTATNAEKIALDPSFVRGVIVLPYKHPVYKNELKDLCKILPVLFLSIGGSVQEKGWMERHFRQQEYNWGLPDENAFFLAFDAITERDLRFLSLVLERSEVPHIIKFAERTVDSRDSLKPWASRVEFWAGGTDEEFPETKALKSHIERCFRRWVEVQPSAMTKFYDLNFLQRWFLMRKAKRMFDNLKVETSYKVLRASPLSKGLPYR
jgi:hypothetical protein